VASLRSRRKKFVAAVAPVPVMLAKTKIFDDVALGVMETDNPVTSVNDDDVVVNVSVFVVLTTCSTEPLVALVAAMYRQAVPFQIASISVSVS
jgi:hypothetical protein